MAYNADLFANTVTVGHAAPRLGSIGRSALDSDGRTGPAHADPSLDRGAHYSLKGQAKPAPHEKEAHLMTTGRGATLIASLAPPQRMAAPLGPPIDRTRPVYRTDRAVARGLDAASALEIDDFLDNQHRSYNVTDHYQANTLAPSGSAEIDDKLYKSQGQVPRCRQKFIPSNVITDAQRRQYFEFASDDPDREGFEVNSGANRVGYKNEGYMNKFNRSRERSDICPYTGRKIDYYRSNPPEQTTDRRITKDQLQHLNPRLRLLQGYDHTQPKKHRREVRQSTFSKPEPDNVFGDLAYQDRIRSEMEERIMRDVWWNRNGESVPKVRDGGEAFGHRGYHNMMRFIPYMEPTMREGTENRMGNGHKDIGLTGRQLNLERGGELNQATAKVRHHDSQRKQGFHGPMSGTERAAVRNQHRTDTKTARDEYADEAGNLAITGGDGAQVHAMTTDHQLEHTRRTENHEQARPKGLIGAVAAFFGMGSQDIVDQTADRLVKPQNRSQKTDMDLLGNIDGIESGNRPNMVYSETKGHERRRTVVDDGRMEYMASGNHVSATRTRQGRQTQGQKHFNQGFDQSLPELDWTRRYNSEQTKIEPQRVNQRKDFNMAGADEFDHTGNQTAKSRADPKRMNVTERIAAGLQPVAEVEFYTSERVENEGSIRGRKNALGSLRQIHTFGDPEFELSGERAETEATRKGRKGQGRHNMKPTDDLISASGERVDVEVTRKGRKGQGRRNMKPSDDLISASGDRVDTHNEKKDIKRNKHDREAGQRAREGGENVIGTSAKIDGDATRMPSKREGQLLKMHYTPGAAEGKHGMEPRPDMSEFRMGHRGSNAQTFTMNYGHGKVVPGTGGSAVISSALIESTFNSSRNVSDRTTRNRLIQGARAHQVETDLIDSLLSSQ